MSSELWRYAAIAAAGLVYFTAGWWFPRLRGLFVRRSEADLIQLLSQVRAEAARQGEDWTEQLQALVKRAWEMRRDDQR